MKNGKKSGVVKAVTTLLVVIAILVIGIVAYFEIMKRSNVPTVDVTEETVTTDVTVSEESLANTGRCGEKAYFIFEEKTNTVTITGTGALWDAGDAQMDHWDAYSAKVKILKISSGITGIGAYSIEGLDSVEEIYISDTVSVIEQQMGGTALSWSDSLQKITVDENNKNYSSDENGVLYNKDKTEIVQYPIGSDTTGFEVPASVKKIGSAAFVDCTNLKIVTLPETVEEFGEDVFMGCSEDLIIRCNENSPAHQFAQENKINYELV